MQPGCSLLNMDNRSQQQKCKYVHCVACQHSCFINLLTIQCSLCSRHSNVLCSLEHHLLPLLCHHRCCALWTVYIKKVLCQASKFVYLIFIPILLFIIIVLIVLTLDFFLRIRKVFCPMCKGVTEITDVLHQSTHLQVGVVPLPLFKVRWI